MTIKDIYFTIGQVSEHADLPQSVLRYWETVFDGLSPAKSAGGSRRYTSSNIEIILEIKNLLYSQGFTIKGANKKLNDQYGFEGKAEKEEIVNNSINTVSQPISVSRKKKINNPDINRKIIKELRKIIAILDE